jgi:drug/metabolite transporter (DMT)-like permease
MNEAVGVFAALLSSSLGGTSIGATRYLIGASDALTLGAFRFGIGFALLLPIALLQRAKWPARADWLGVAGLGLLFFAVFPILFNASLIFTTAARGALALSTLPVLTMLVGATFGVEALTLRKSAGVLVAMLGVAVALISGLAGAPAGAWKGDILMISGALCMALYNVWSRPFVRRSAPTTFAAMGMAVGAACLIVAAAAHGGFARVAAFAAPQWLAILYLGIFGGALTFLLWAFALSRTTPTRVAISITVNPVAAALVGALLLGEPIGWNLIVGLATVLLGIWLATSVGWSLTHTSRPVAGLDG